MQSQLDAIDLDGLRAGARASSIITIAAPVCEARRP
jgi:hypothetical protein